MRERLVATFVGLTVLVVVMYGVPRAYFLADLVRSDEQARVDRTALALEVVVEQHLADGRSVTPSFLASLAQPGEVVTYDDAAGSVSAGPDGSDAEITATREVEGGGTLTVGRADDVVRDRISEAILPLVLIGLALVAIAAAAGLVLARRLARPFQQLADAARALGAGQFHPVVPDQLVPEARAIGEALIGAGADLEALVQHERALAVRASHELRTPVTALRLELEDLALWPETPPVVAAELRRSVGELDRLSAAVDDLLTMSEASRRDRTTELDLDRLLADLAADPRADGVVVEHRRTGPAPARLARDAVSAAVDALVDVAAAGADTVRLELHRHHGHHDVVVTASPTPVAATSYRSGLDAAAEHAAGLGGRVSREGAALVLRLPTDETSPAADPGRSSAPGS